MTEETKQEQGKRGFRIPGWEAGKEVMGQLVRPWFDATATTLSQVQNLQQRVLDRTQDAVRETFEFVQEGVKQCANVNDRMHRTMQDQLKRFGTK